MPDGTQPLRGHGPRASHSPIYQGAISVKCHHCPRTHKLMWSSDERNMVETQIDTMVQAMREAGYRPRAILTESYHPGTDLTIREWGTVEEMLDQHAGGEAY